MQDPSRSPEEDHGRGKRMMMELAFTEAGEVRRDLDLERIAAYLRPLGSPLRLRLLRLLTQPHYIEEIASSLKLSRQATRKHLNKLLAIGVLEKRAGERDAQSVTDYVVNLQALFLIYDEFEKLGSLRPRTSQDLAVRTRERPVRGGTGEARLTGPCLLVVRGFSFGQTVPLVPQPGRAWTIGRDRTCDLSVSHDPYASSRQAEVTYADGQFVLTDLRSTNGTEHNLVGVPSGSSLVLRHGDLVGVGRTLLLFWEHGREGGEG